MKSTTSLAEMTAKNAEDATSISLKPPTPSSVFQQRQFRLNSKICMNSHTHRTGEHPTEEWSNQVELQASINQIMQSMDENTNISFEDIAKIEPFGSRTSRQTSTYCMDHSTAKKASPLKIKRLGPIGRRMTRARARDPDVNLAKVRHVSTLEVPLGDQEN